jgi:tetratricopeptide (TPR) repeat protein
MKIGSRTGFPAPATLLAAALLVAPAAAQWGSTPGSWHTSKVGVADDLGADGLETARRAAEAGDVGRAAEVYQELLDRLPDLVAQKIRAPRTGDETERVLSGDVFEGLRGRVHREIKALPGGGLATYRARFGPRAQIEFDRALEASDEAALRRLARSFRLTDAGAKAAAALADFAFEEGRVDDAALYAESFLNDADPDVDDPSAVRRAYVRAGLAYAAGGRRAALADLRARATKLSGDATLRVGAAEKTVVEALDGFLSTMPPEPPPPPPSDPVFDSRPFAPIELRLQNARRSEEKFIAFPRSYVDPPSSYAPVVPSIEHGTIYVNDGLELSAYGLFSGRKLFSVRGRSDDFQGRRNWNATLECVVDRGAVFTYLEDEPQRTADPRHNFQGFVPVETIGSKKLYAIDARTGAVLWTHARLDGAKDADERAFLARLSVTSPPLVVGERLYVGGGYYHGGFRQWLCCFDRATGAIVWRTFVALGQTEQNMFGNPVKDCPAGLVAERRGTLVFSTNIGVAAAVDAATGTPKWISAYEQEEIPSVDGPGALERPPGWAAHRPVFTNTKAIVAPADCLDVLAFDLETGEAKPIRDPERGVDARRRHRRTERFRHVVGLFDGLLIVAGTEIAAFDATPLDSGGDAILRWRADHDRLAGDGRPAVDGDRLWFTTRANQGPRERTTRARLVAIDLRTGRAVDERFAEIKGGAGAIVFGEDAAVVASALPDGSYSGELTAHFDLGRAAERTAAAVAASPHDASLLLRLAQLRLQQGSPDEAIAAYERALGAAETQGVRGEALAVAARRGLHDLYLALGADFKRAAPGVPPSPEARFDLALKFAADGSQRAAALFQRLIYAHRASKTDLLFETARLLATGGADAVERVDPAFVEALRAIDPDRPMRLGLQACLVAASAAERAKRHDAAAEFHVLAMRRFGDETVTRVGGEDVSAWRFAYDAIDAAIRNYGREVYAAEDAEARRLVASAKGDRAALVYRTIVDDYPNSELATEARTSLVRALREAGKPKEALAAAQREMARLGVDGPEIVFETARALEAAGLYDSAADVWKALRARFALRVVDMGDGAALRVSDLVDRRLSESPYDAAVATRKPAAPLGATIAWREEAAEQGGVVALVSPSGTPPKSALAVVLVAADGELRALDANSGARLWTYATSEHPLFPIWRDGKLFAAFGDDLASIDPADGRLAWRVRLPEGRPTALDVAHGKVYALAYKRELSSAPAVVLRTLDAATGERLRDHVFSREAARVVGAGAPSIETNALHVLVRVPDADRAAVFDGLTGAPVHGGVSMRAAAGVPPFLGRDDLLVYAPTPTQVRSKELKLVGRKLSTNEDVWTWRADMVASATAHKVGPDAVLVLLDRVAGNSSRTEREAVLLDLSRGTTLLSKRLAPQEYAQYGVLDDDQLLLCVRRHGQVFVRSYDVSKDELKWETVPGSGRSAILRIYPTRDHVLVRFTSEPSNPAERMQFVRTGHVRWIDRRTGLVLDEAEVEGDLKVLDRPDVEVRDGLVLIESRNGVDARR